MPDNDKKQTDTSKPSPNKKQTDASKPSPNKSKEVPKKVDFSITPTEQGKNKSGSEPEVTQKPVKFHKSRDNEEG
jgi:hypothetical protein